MNLDTRLVVLLVTLLGLGLGLIVPVLHAESAPIPAQDVHRIAIALERSTELQRDQTRALERIEHAIAEQERKCR